MGRLQDSEYDLELNKVLEEIRNSKSKLVLLQFPDGLKQYAGEVIDYLKEELGVGDVEVEFFSYFGSCFGACDIPFYLKDMGFDLCIQFGHSEYIKNKEMW